MNESFATQLLLGRPVADQLIGNVAEAVRGSQSVGGVTPGLAVVLVGDDPASEVYVSHKIRACAGAGLRSMDHVLPHGVSQNELLALIDQLNADPEVHGILVQLPLPTHLDEHQVTSHIDPAKDVDGFHPYNLGLLAQRNPGLRPCTPRGVMTLLHAYGIDAKRRDAVVVGASNIVGRPLSFELLLAGATVTTCHRFTRDLADHVSRAELLCVAVGNPDVVKAEWVKPGAVVIDIGITRRRDGSLHGDLDADALMGRAAWLTPVPGGVGPMTVATLMQNTAEAAGLRVPAPVLNRSN